MQPWPRRAPRHHQRGATAPPRPAGAMSQFRWRRPPEAENRARQIRGKLVWHRTAALGFGRLRRPRRPRPRGESVGSARLERSGNRASEAKPLPHIYGRRTHLKRRPPSRARGQAGHGGGTLNATRSAGRGWESQGQSLAERGRTTQRPRAEDIPLAEGEPEGRTSGGATHNSADFGDSSRTRPSARGRCARAEGVGLPEREARTRRAARGREAARNWQGV